MLWLPYTHPFALALCFVKDVSIYTLTGFNLKRHHDKFYIWAILVCTFCYNDFTFFEVEMVHMTIF